MLASLQSQTLRENEVLRALEDGTTGFQAQQFSIYRRKCGGLRTREGGNGLSLTTSLQIYLVFPLAV